MKSTNAAEVLVEILKVNGVRHIFGVIGDALFPLFNVLGQQSDIRYFGAAHESGAAFMASYYAKITGRMGVCMATSGPGAANLINGLADAYFDSAPVLAITGQVETSKLGTGAKQDVNQQQLFQAVTARSKLVTSPESLIPIVTHAISIAAVKRTVTHVSIPVDLFNLSTTLPELHPVPQSSTGWSVGFADLLEEALTEIEFSQRPLLLVGTADRRLKGKLIELAEKISAGIVLTQQAKGLIPDTCPSVVGGIGEAFNPRLISEADCILLLGSASYEQKFLPAGMKIIQVAEHSEELRFVHPAVNIAGDLRLTVKVLLERLSRKRNPVWQEKIEGARSERQSLIHAQIQNEEVPIHPAHLMIQLSSAVPKDAVIVCDIGSFIHWFDTYFTGEHQTVLMSVWWRSMGSGLPGALGVCTSEIKRKVIVLTGDGGLLMSSGELATAVKYNLPVTIIIANNGEYNLERTMMENKGLQPYGHNIEVPDFVKMAEAFGVHAKAVYEPAQLKKSLDQFLAWDGPSLLDVHLSKVNLPALK